MIRLVSESGRLFVELRDEMNMRRRVDFSSLLILGTDAQAFLNPLVHWVGRTKFQSQLNVLQSIARLGRPMTDWKMKALPGSSTEWQNLMYNLYDYWLGKGERNASLRTRVAEWNKRIEPAFRFLRDSEDVIPIDVVIPRGKPGGFGKSERRQNLLGDSDPWRVRGKVTKTLVSISLARTDAEYLDEIRDALTYRREVLDRCFKAWWKQIHEHFEYGQRLLRQTNWPRLQARLKTGRVFEPLGVRGHAHIANGQTEVSLGNLLAMLVYQHDGLISKHLFNNDPHLPVARAIKMPLSAPSVVSSLVTIRDRLNWMLGNLSINDVAIATAALILHNPRFTPVSTLYAKAYDKYGRRYLEMDGDQLAFRLAKNRARAMKRSQLDEFSAGLLDLIWRMTARSRKVLRKKKSLLVDQLFFVSSKGGKTKAATFGHTRRFITGKWKKCKKTPPRWVGSYFPEIEKVGMGRGTVSFSRIRHTEGVLEWFRTGSISAVSKKLGNSQRVVLAHYLPKPLLAAWNARQIRRFQNLWLVVAAANEPFLLDVTDFRSLGDLHSFLADMLSMHKASSSPLAKELHKRFRAISADDTQDRLGSELSIPISAQVLRCLYLYQESALKAGVSAEVLDKEDAETRIKPRQFLDLAQLLRHQLPSHRDPRFRRAHEEALSDLPRLLRRSSWSELIASRGTIFHAKN